MTEHCSTSETEYAFVGARQKVRLNLFLSLSHTWNHLKAKLNFQEKPYKFIENISRIIENSMHFKVEHDKRNKITRTHTHQWICNNQLVVYRKYMFYAHINVANISFFCWFTDSINSFSHWFSSFSIVTKVFEDVFDLQSHEAVKIVWTQLTYLFLAKKYFLMWQLHFRIEIIQINFWQ